MPEEESERPQRGTHDLPEEQEGEGVLSELSTSLGVKHLGDSTGDPAQLANDTAEGWDDRVVQDVSEVAKRVLVKRLE
jgi:hypothetical protein